MKIGVYAIRDAKIEAFMQPFYARTDAEAKRGFSGAVNNGTGQVHDYPEDYALYKIADYNDSNGELTPHEHVSLGKGIEFKND